jgi:hypothetical protein
MIEERHDRRMMMTTVMMEIGHEKEKNENDDAGNTTSLRL